MTMWWIGVKGNKVVAFEATKVEAFSPDFEQQFGVAFGSYRSKEQADSGIKEHGGALVLEAEKVLASRQEQPEIEQKQPEEPLRTSKPAQLAEDAVWDAEDSLFSALNAELNGLKVSIVRVLGVIKELKEHKREKSEDNRKKA